MRFPQAVLLDELGWEKPEYVRLKQLAMTMSAKSMIIFPRPSGADLYQHLKLVHSHNLSISELNYYVPRPRTESAKGSLHYRGSVLWNKIPSEIRNLPSLNVFKTLFHGKDYLNTS